MRQTMLAAFLLAAFATGTAPAAQPLDNLNARLAAAAPSGGGIALAEIRAAASGPETLVSVSGDPALKPDTSFRLASNTKTYTAATILRLWEDGKLQLDESIRRYVDPAYIALLEKDGYDTARITVRHLLSHTSGMADHAQTREFLHVIETRPATAWTRQDQLEWLVRWTDPIAAPGVKFSYSDSGYCLLGNIIERLTGQPLASAVRQALDFQKLGLTATWWETQEAPPARAGARAHVILNGKDTYDWNPSLDMYGGGGLVATPQDMARFLFALFEGEVFKRPGTLDVMLSREGLPADSPYRLGIFEYDAGGLKAYGHAGFWGTAAVYLPQQHRAYALAVTHRDAFTPAFDTLKASLPNAAP
jgi:D-alanyl-D-alanine carboxypeptidase